MVACGPVTCAQPRLRWLLAPALFAGCVCVCACRTATPALEPAADAVARGLTAHYPPGPGTVRYRTAEGETVERERTSPDDAGRWTETDGDRVLELGADARGVVLFGLEAPGRGGAKVVHVFEPPLVFMPPGLDGAVFESESTVRAETEGRTFEGTARREVALRDDGSLIERLTIKTDATVVRTVRRPDPGAVPGVEERTLRVTVFGLRVRQHEETLTPQE